MPERIAEGAGAIAVELILHRALDDGAARNRLRRQCIDVVDVEVEADRGAAGGLLTAPISGNSSASMTMESPMRISAWPILPLGSAMRKSSVAPNARL